MLLLRKRLTDAAQVDHFVPWALYPSNLGHNFVLADASCNADKSDLIADVPHLNRWCSRNDRAGRQFEQAFEALGIVTDLGASRGIARWAYERARSTTAATRAARHETRGHARRYRVRHLAYHLDTGPVDLDAGFDRSLPQAHPLSPLCRNLQLLHDVAIQPHLPRR